MTEVLIVTGGIPNNTDPLSGIFEFDQAKALAAAGCDVTYFSIDLRSIRRIRKWGCSSGIKDGVKWWQISIPLGPVPEKIYAKIGSVALKALYKKVFKQHRVDVIHAHFTLNGLMAIDLSKSLHIPIVVTEHSSKINRSCISKGLLNCARRVYRDCDVLVAVSSLLAKRISNISGRQPIVVPNMIDLQLFGKTKLEKHQGFHIAVTARLIEHKRVKNLIRALAILKGNYRDIYLDVVGDGQERDNLIKYVNDSKMQNHVTFYGRLTREETLKVYAQSDCFALVSVAETFGVVYVEAMAAGLPVIASRCGGPEDFVCNTNGLLVDVDNENQLCDAIEYMYNHRYDKYDSQVIKATVEKFHPTNVSNKLIEIYNSSI